MPDVSAVTTILCSLFGFNYVTVWICTHTNNECAVPASGSGVLCSYEITSGERGQLVHMPIVIVCMCLSV